VTAVAFHFGAPDKLAYVCRLLRKATIAGAKVLVLAPDSIVTRLDSDLWALSPTEFIPHCVGTAQPVVKKRSAVVLASDIVQAPSLRQVLLNLGQTVPTQFALFERVIEVVSTDETDRNHARMRWRDYTERGYPITRHDLNLRGTLA
jgi:DNA polymerase-3 subunit chi